MKKLVKSMGLGVIILISILISYSHTRVATVDNSIFIDKFLVDKYIKEEDKYMIIDIRYPQVINTENSENLSKEIEGNIYRVIDEVKSIIKEYYGDVNEFPSVPYQIYSNYYVTNVEKVLSFYYEIYQFTGGAHGSTTRYSYNIDIDTGENLTLEKLFKDKDYKKIIDDEINKQINMNKDEYFLGKDGFNGVNENTEFYINGDTLIIYFQQYEIAPYVKGIPEFKIDMSKIK